MPPSAQRQNTPRCRPTLELLEGRLTPASLGLDLRVGNPPPAAPSLVTVVTMDAHGASTQATVTPPSQGVVPFTLVAPASFARPTIQPGSTALPAELPRSFSFGVTGVMAMSDSGKQADARRSSRDNTPVDNVEPAEPVVKPTELRIAPLEMSWQPLSGPALDATWSHEAEPADALECREREPQQVAAQNLEQPAGAAVPLLLGALSSGWILCPRGDSKRRRDYRRFLDV